MHESDKGLKRELSVKITYCWFLLSFALVYKDVSYIQVIKKKSVVEN